MKIKRSKPANRYGQASLIGMLVAIAIIVVLAAAMYPQMAANHSQAGDPATPKERAYNTACSEYESQMNQAAFMYKNDHDDQPPKSLNDLKKYGISDDMIHAEGCYFQIDPATGHVSDLGHGKYVPVAPPASATYSGRATGFHPDSPTPTPAPNAGYNQPMQPAPAPAVQPAPGGGTVGPGGIKIPNIPTADPGSE
jgi:flagellin-like protein